jgi:hypothetical protein
VGHCRNRSFDCGYPASSLKERVYALSGPDGAPERCGILIYTATAGAQGTLGGWSERRQDLRKSSKAHWNGQGSARTIRSAPTINRTTAAAIAPRTELRAMAACSSQRRAAK